MAKLDWKVLRDADITMAWKLVADALMAENIFPEMLLVTNIEDVPYFNLMVCFTKSESGFLNQFIRSAEYRIQGHITELVKKVGNPKTDLKNLMEMCSEIRKEKHVIEGYMNTWHSGKKAIKVEMMDISKEAVNMSINEGNVVLDTFKDSLKGISNIYIINEVIYAERVQIRVNVGYQTKLKTFERIPVAFSYKKFLVDNKGDLHASVVSNIDTTAEFLPIDT